MRQKLLADVNRVWIPICAAVFFFPLSLFFSPLRNRFALLCSQVDPSKGPPVEELMRFVRQVLQGKENMERQRSTNHSTVHEYKVRSKVPIILIRGHIFRPQLWGCPKLMQVPLPELRREGKYNSEHYACMNGQLPGRWFCWFLILLHPTQ